MGAVAEIKGVIKQQGGFRQTHFNQAARWYAARARAVPAGMRAEPLVYARLASQYVHWTVGVLGTVAATAARETAVRPLVERLCQLAVWYFRHPEEWPSPDPVLRAPLTLAAPACYTLRVVRAANELT
jgi:hypothetical protein